ncbi:MAG: acetoin utilization protein AcuC [Thaumarchaeota archaeon]|nr:acetoin utilization protein AcuC [Nitrososphaerota archaeon]
MQKFALFYGEALRKYAFPAGHPFRVERVEKFWELANQEGIAKSEKVQVCEPVLASETDVLSFHIPEYVEFVKKASQVGSGYLDRGDTPAFKGVFEASLYVVGTTLRALDMVMSDRTSNAFNPVGGLHHAWRDKASGFCVFNDAAIAIMIAKSKYKLDRILYVDIDAHHGDGVFYEFYNDPEVWIADMHEDGRFLFPGTGFENEIGSGKASGRKMNIVMDAGAGLQEFKKAFARVMQFAKRAEPELILLQCGADGLAGDPITHLRYTPDCHKFAAENLYAMSERFCKGKVVAMGGGGYNLDNVARAWLEIVKGLAH